MKKRILSTILTLALAASTAVAVLPAATASAKDLTKVSAATIVTDELAKPILLDHKTVSPDYYTIDWKAGDISYKTNPYISYKLVINGKDYMTVPATETHICIARPDVDQTAYLVTVYSGENYAIESEKTEEFIIKGRR